MVLGVVVVACYFNGQVSVRKNLDAALRRMSRNETLKKTLLVSSTTLLVPGKNFRFMRLIKITGWVQEGVGSLPKKLSDYDSFYTYNARKQS